MAHRLSLPSWLQWQLLLRRADPWRLAALAACLAAAALHWVALPIMEQRVRMPGGQTQDAAAPQDLRTAEATLVEERFQAFRDRLIDDDKRTEVLKKVFAEAMKNGIALQQGNYALLAEPEGDFDKLQISLPLQGAYPQIRVYIRMLLETIPALSLDEIGFRRDSVRNHNVDAKLRLTLYMKRRSKQ